MQFAKFCNEQNTKMTKPFEDFLHYRTNWYEITHQISKFEDDNPGQEAPEALRKALKEAMSDWVRKGQRYTMENDLLQISDCDHI